MDANTSPTETRPILSGRADWIGSRGQMRGILVPYGQDPQPGDTVRWYSTSRGPVASRQVLGRVLAQRRNAVDGVPMIRITYRPLAFARTYESVCLPAPPRRTDSYAIARPDPIGDAVARGPRPRARTTTEIPIAVDATLPAIAAAIDRLERDLATLGLGHHAARVRAIAKAVDGVRDGIDRGDADTLHRALRG